ncbi:rhodanese-like domain-containing protein [Mesobacillus subterraneus]|uniref:rhodanese-like domain-containing protein n=1 Tax=Mesobacillus subterraneus TaxID=285983 RepID=UPI00273E88A3|nr:rhodanese-like domain-containing protein [Mesobacillus subterraneus]WLR54063.1 rhodanese-like domain-containing protein [Mesobacillus subterraneus]
MVKKTMLAGLIFSVGIVIAGCGTGEYLAKPNSNAAADFNQKADLSIYKVAEEATPEKEAVPLKDNLTYVDTEYMMRLKASEGEVSPARKTYDQFPSEWDFVIVDSRPQAVFHEGHINGAINIPDSQFDQFASLLPEDKNKLLIFYCGGVTCELSSSSAEKAIKLGYKNIKVYQEGLPEWKKAGNYLAVTAPYVKELIMDANVSRDDKPPFVILDARPYKIYFESHIPNAVFADDTLFAQKYIGIAPADKKTEIIVYCGGFGCHKSHAVAEELLKKGYSNVKVYSGGLPDWTAKSLPTFGTANSDGSFNVAEGQVNRGINPEEFMNKISAGAFILDVRSKDETKAGVFKGSLNIPDSIILADPAAIASQLPKDKNAVIVIHCASGARGPLAL